MTEGRRYVGIDWGAHHHEVWVEDERGEPLGTRRVRHDGAGLQALWSWSLALAEGDPSRLWVAIETPRSALVDLFVLRGAQVFSVNPKQLARFRESQSAARLKDDRRDAHSAAQALRLSAHLFRKLTPQSPERLRIRELRRLLETLSQERTRVHNRILRELRRYYPQLLQLGGKASSTWWLHLWKRLPTPDKARRVRVETLAQWLKQHRVRRWTAESLKSVLSAPALPVAPGVVEAIVEPLRWWVPQMIRITEQHRATGRELEHALQALAEQEQQEKEQRDVEVLSSLPGVGRTVLATLITEAQDPLARRDYQALRALTGVAPITRQSGGQRRVALRRASHVGLRHAIYHWARIASLRDASSKTYYTRLRARGHSHARALRSVGDRLLRIACAMLRDQTLYEKKTASRGTPRETLEVLSKSA